jgi:hypothetical protein
MTWRDQPKWRISLVLPKWSRGSSRAALSGRAWRVFLITNYWFFGQSFVCSSTPIDVMAERRNAYAPPVCSCLLQYARLVGVARSRSWTCACWSRGRLMDLDLCLLVAWSRTWTCACWSHGRAPGQVPAGPALDMRGRIFLVFLYPPPTVGGRGGLFNYLLRCCTMSLSALSVQYQ